MMLQNQKQAINVLDIISLAKHDVITVSSIDIKINLSYVRRPSTGSLFHLLQTLLEFNIAT